MNRKQLLVSLLLLCAGCVAVYSPILREHNYPWGEDALGHVVRAEYLWESVQKSDYFPNLYPGWHAGVQVYRYYSPLPYYFIIALCPFTGDIVSATNWYIALMALAGAASCLLFWRWLGWLPALSTGLLFLFLPDNIRVAIVDGNIPRLLTTACIPGFTYCVLRAVEASSSRRHVLGLVGLSAIMTFTHPMTAAIYMIFCGLLIGLLWLWEVTTFKRLCLCVAAISIGTLLQGWWLIPSLEGGLTELDKNAVQLGLERVPWFHYFQPFQRVTGPFVTYYIGGVLLLAPLILIFIRSGRNRMNIALAVIALGAVVWTLPSMAGVAGALPLSGVLVPVRFLGIASFFLLISLAWRLAYWRGRAAGVGWLLLGLVAADSAVSLTIVRTKPVQADMFPIKRILDCSAGWRAAALDFSKQGSAPSYFLRENREQIFGWAYYATRIASTNSGLNEAIEYGMYAFVQDRLDVLGADDVVLLKELSGLDACLISCGFERLYAGQRNWLYHRDGYPRAVVANWRVLGIGRCAQNLAYVFPQMLIGGRFIDEYTVDELCVFDTIFISGIRYHDKEKAEALIEAVVSAGRRVVVDMTSAPVDATASCASLLGVQAPRFVLNGEPLYVAPVASADSGYALRSFGDLEKPWYTHKLEGLDRITMMGHLRGGSFPVVGTKKCGAGEVHFVAVNLPYQCLLQNDPATRCILEQLLGLPALVPSSYTFVPLLNYQAHANGYSFKCDLPSDCRLLLPFACHPGMELLIDGQICGARAFEGLIYCTVPAGECTVSIQFPKTGRYYVGYGVSLLSLICLAGVILWWRKLSEKIS